MNWLRMVIQWVTFNRVNANRNKLTYVARRSFTSHHSYFSLLQPCRKHKKYIAQIILASYFSMPGVLLAQGVSAAANSVHAPGFDTAANGTPIVNINAPSSKGVSRNEYNDLNVDTKGLIFNNATDIVKTQLAGFIDGNSKLNGNSANIILNEVKGNSRSALNGYMEIAGRSAELIIANQNGITCNGCGFINTTRGTLTTGLPTFDGSGGLTGFDVSKGDVDISGLGLNASNVDEVDILARSVSLNSKFWAKNATIVTGQNQINYQDKKVTAAVGTSGSGISLDVAAIGGMYANRIRLIGTEKGLGVNVAGELKAVEDMTLDSQGNLSNSGTLSADNIQIQANALENSGAILGNNVSLATTQTMVNSNQEGQIHATLTLNLSSDGDIFNQNEAIVSSDDQLVIHTKGTLSNLNSANIYSANDMTLQTQGELVHQASTIEAARDLTLISQAFNNDANSTLLAQNGTLSIAIGKQEDDDTIVVTGPLTNNGTLTGKKVTLTATAIHNDTSDSQISATGGLTLIATQGEVSNTNGASIRANDLLTIEAATDLINTTSQIESEQNLRLSSRNIDNTADALIRANDTITMDWRGALTNDKANIEAKNKIQTSQSEEDNVEKPRSGSLTNLNGGYITAQNGSLNLTLGHLSNQASIGANRVILNTSSLSNIGSNGAIVANEHLDLSSSSYIDNYDGASLFSLGSGDLYAKGNITNSSADIETRGGDLTIKANKIINKRSLVRIKNKSVSKSYENLGDIRVIQEGKDGKSSRPKITEQTITTYTETIVTPYIAQISAEGNITSQGSLSVEGHVDNLYSTISANNNLQFNGMINNQSLTATQTITTNGTDRHIRKYHAYWHESNSGGWSSHSGVTKETTTNFNRSNTKSILLISPTLSSKNAITGKGGSVQNVGTADAVAEGLSHADIIKQRQNAIFDDLSMDDYIRSAQFAASQSSDSGYLIETNPLFTNYKTFISSDYLLNKMLGDSKGRTGKTASRLGDGYLEQQMVRQQILSYTGQQTLPDQVDIESAYATLMDNALEEYEELQLSTGIALSDEQVAQLKRPIVWMVTETVQTASGPQQALVPKVYLPNTDDLMLRTDGALIAANIIDIEVDENVANSGTILASNGVSIKAKNISNTGTLTAKDLVTLDASEDLTSIGGNISGQNAHLSAGQDIKLVASSVEAQDSLALTAGNDIQLSATQSTQSTGFTDDVTITTTHDVTQLTGNKIALNAEFGNVTSEAARIKASQSIDIRAKEVKLLALADSTKRTIDNSNKWNLRSKDITTSSSVTHQLSQLEAGSINIQAAETITSQGAQINATDNLQLSAKNIDLFAVTDSKDGYSFLGGSGNSTEIRTHNEDLTGTTLSAGGSLTLVSQEDVFSEGSTLNGGTGITLAAGGDAVLATAVANNSSFEEVKKKKSSFFGSKRSTTTTTSESITNQGTNLTSGGDIQIASEADILLSGTKATAAGGIDLQAKGDIQLLTAVDQTSSRYQKQKKGTFTASSKDKGSIKQTAVTSDLIANGESGNGNIVLASGSNVTLEGATLAANDTLSMGASADTQETVSKDANGNYVNANGEQIGNVTVGTKALQSSEWSESSSGFRGILKDLAKGLAVVAAVGTGGLVHGDIKVGEADSTRTDTLKQQTTTLAANDLNISAQNNLALIGANVSVDNTASLTANDITIDAAHEQTIVSNSHTEQTISGKGATLEKDQVSLVSLTETDQTERTTTTANTWAGSNINAGNLKINAKQNVAILASDVNVQNNADIKGDNILVGGRDATTDTTHDSITKTNTISVGVRNTYVDVALATEALKDAKDAVSDAKNAYDDAKQKVAEGKLPESDLDFYENKLDSAKKSEKLANLAVVNAGVTAAMSSATAGFTATAGASTQVTTNTTTATQSNWNGSTINVGNNASLNGQNNLIVEGSAITAQGALEANAKNIDILAGKNTYTETTSSQTKGASASVTASLGGGMSGSVGVNTSKSNSDNQSTQYSNSRLSAGTLKSNSDQLSIQGGNLSGDEVVINTNNLDVVSQQATSTSHSESQGKGINLGGSANSDSVSVSYNQSQTDSDYASVTQQSSITTGDKGYQINVAGNTNLVGGLITSTDKAEASGNNTFSTSTLTQTDLANHAVYSGSSMGVDVGISSTTDSHGDSGFGFSNSMGQGSAGDSRQSTTQSGINTANLAITDADKQQQLTGQSVADALADAHTTTSTDTADINSGILKNTFNQADVEAQLNQQREVTQAFSKTVQEVKGAITNSINQQKDALNTQLKNGEINQTEYDQQTATLDNYSLLANTISAGLSAPTDSLAGQVAAAASPAVANQIGQYFKGLAANNENGQLNAGQETAHVLAHGILAAAVASAGGNDATTAGIAAAGSEAAAPVLAKWLYGKDSSDNLNATEKQTLTAILSAASTTVGATTGNVNNAIAAGQAGQNAVENNSLTTLQMGTLVNELIACEGDSDCQQETREKYQEISDQNVQNMVANCAAGGATSDACLDETKQLGLAITDFQSGKFDAFSTGTTEDDILNVFRDINLKDRTLAGELAAGAVVDELAAQHGWSKEQAQAITIAVATFAARKGMRNAKGVNANATSAGSDVVKGAGKYDVGLYNEIKGTVSGLDAHHAGQKAAMKKLVNGYDPSTGPSILVPKVGHTIKGPNGIVSRSTKGIDSARDLLARDVKELRRVYTDVPNSQLQKLINLNKEMYPSEFKK